MTMMFSKGGNTKYVPEFENNYRFVPPSIWRVVFPFKSEGSRISFSFPRSSARSFKFQSPKFHRILPPRRGILKKTSSSQGIIFFRLKFTCHFPINQINQIVYEFWKRLTRETTPFKKSGHGLPFYLKIALFLAYCWLDSFPLFKPRLFPILWRLQIEMYFCPNLTRTNGEVWQTSKHNDIKLAWIQNTYKTQGNGFNPLNPKECQPAKTNKKVSFNWRLALRV